MKTRATSLATAVANLARDAVRIQERLDQAAEEASEQFAYTLAQVPEEGRALFLPLAPLRQVVTEHHVRCSIQVGLSVDARAELMIAPVKLGMSAAYSEREQAISTLGVLVVQAPSWGAADVAPTLPLATGE